MEGVCGVFLLCVGVCFSALQHGFEDTEQQLITSLLKDYLPSARPPQDVTNISIAFALEQFKEMDVRQQMIRIKSYITLTWIDSRLSWNSSDWYNIYTVALPSSLIWKPDMALINSASAIYNSDYYSSFFLVEVDYDGTVTWIPGGVFSTKCKADLMYYPFDQQVCSLLLRNWVYGSEEIVLTPTSGTMDVDETFIQDGQWEVLQTEVLVIDDMQSGVEYRMTLRRKPRWYLINMVVPCILFSVIACFVFMTPDHSDEKMSLNMTLLISFSVFQLMVADSIPKSSDFTPLMSTYLILVMSMTALSLILSILIMKITYYGSAGVPHWVEKVFLNRFSFLLLSSVDPIELTNPALKGIDQAQQKVGLNSERFPRLKPIHEILQHVSAYQQAQTLKRSNRLKWRQISEILQRALFGIFVLLMAAATIKLLSTGT